MDMKDQKLATEIAEERMTLIAPLLSQNLDKDSVRLIRAEICERNQISQRTLERYLTSYLKGGFDALKPQSRSAECKYKIPQELLDEAIRLRRELPSRSVPTIIKILELEGKAEPGFLKRTGPVLSHLSTLTKIAGLLLMTGWYSSSWWARSLESTNEGSGSGPSLLLYDKILQRRLFAPPAGHPCPASSDKTARPFYDRTARPRHIPMRRMR